MTVASQIFNELVKPTQGVRIPTFPERRRTGLLGQSIPTTISVGQVSATTNLVLLRDPNFPLWATMTPNAIYSAAWLGQVRPLVTFLAANEVVSDTMTIQQATSGTTTQPSITNIAGTPYPGLSHGQVPMAVFPEVDQQPWLWVPKGATVLFGLTYGSTLASGIVTGQVQLERRIGSSWQEEDITVVCPALAPTAGSGIVAQSVFVGADFALDGIWVRVKQVTTVAGGGGGSFVDNWAPTAVLAVCNNLTATINAATAAPQFTALTLVPSLTTLGLLLPLVGPYTSRHLTTGSNSSLSQAIKVVGMALSGQNTTAVVNQEGHLSCARFLEGSNTLGRLIDDTDIGRIIPTDKMVSRLANGFYTFVRPGPEFKFMNSTVTLPVVQTATTAIPVLTLINGMNLHLLRMVDTGLTTTTSIMLQLQYSVEFVTTDVLLHPRPAAGVIHDTEAAIIKAENAQIFVPRARPVEALVDRTRLTGGMDAVLRQVEGPRPSKPHPKPKPKTAPPKPKAQPKPKGEKAGKPAGKGRK